MIQHNIKYCDYLKLYFLGILLFLISSCGGGDSIKKNPYCEFVDGQYTFDIDLRRSLFFVGKDFEYEYYTQDMKDCRVEDASYVMLKAMGHYFDENVRDEENVDIFYTSLIELPAKNRVNDGTLNILTTLEAERIIYLVRSGYSYTEAKELVKEEIWNQLKESGLFSYYDFLNVKAFEDLNIDDECLKSLTAYFSKMIINTCMVVEDKTLCGSVLIDFINNYATTGDLELSTFNLDVFSQVDSDIFSLSGEEILLKSSIAYYKIPFDGGVPHIHNNVVYYGIDTSTFNNLLNFPEYSKLSLHWPKYKSFTCNGYFDLHGKFVTDSINKDEQIEIIITDVAKKTVDTTISISKDLRKCDFSKTLWIEKEGKYQITVKHGDRQIDLDVNNLLDYSAKED